LAALNPNNTQRFYLTYNVDTYNHTLCARSDAGVTAADASTGIGGFLTAMSTQVGHSVFVKFEVSTVGSNVRNPVTWSGPTSWGGSGSDAAAGPRFWSFTGKDVEGHKVRVDLFGRTTNDFPDYRLPAATYPIIQAAIDALNTSIPIFLTINSAGPTWNGYANQAYSQHWIKQARK